MRVLIACEFSGVVRDAFSARGHDAMSCDLLPTESPGVHYEGDVFECVRQFPEGWFDLMVAHPPCTYLTVAGNGWANRPGRAELMHDAVRFFKALYDLPIEKVCLENPVGRLSTLFRKPDQYIQPWQFGHETRKATGLWLRGLPKLTPTNIIEPEAVKGVSPKGKKYYSLNWLPQTEDRWKIRSRFFPGVAAAMADQWGELAIRTLMETL